MKNLFLLCLFVLGSITISQAQNKKIEINIDSDEISESIREAMKEVKIALEEIDFEQIKIDIREAMPTDEEIEEMKKEIKIAIDEIEEVDLSELDEAMEELDDVMKELSEMFKDLEIDIRTSKDEKKDKKKDN